MARLFSADWHRRRSIKLMVCPFSTQQEHVDFLVAKHNAVVKPEDTLWMVGDAVYKNAKEFLPQVAARFNGTKVLYRGNHDVVFTDEELKQYFSEIVPEGDGRTINLGDVTCWVTHYPTQGKEDMFNIVGHIHAAWKFQLNMLNVGVDVHHFAPVPAGKCPDT